MGSIYVAASYPRKEEMGVVAAILEEQGYTVTSTWLNDYPVDYSEARAARTDLDDILNSNIFMMFMDAPMVQLSSGGRHVELGWALQGGLRCILIGEEKECIFHYLPQIEHYYTLEEFLHEEQIRGKKGRSGETSNLARLSAILSEGTISNRSSEYVWLKEV